jgi:hypothetical protein
MLALERGSRALSWVLEPVQPRPPIHQRAPYGATVSLNQ